MKKFAACAMALGILIATSLPCIAQALVLKSFNQLVFQSAAMQPDEIRVYLQKMKTIMDRYTSVVFQAVTGGGPTGPSPEAISSASLETQQLANDIANVKAPQEIASEHKQLAMMMENVDSFLKSSSGAGPAMLPQAMGLIGTVQSTISSYHTGVQNLIRKHNLPESLDPLGGDQANLGKQQQLNNLMETMKGNLLTPQMPQTMMPSMGGMDAGGSLFGGSTMGGGGLDSGLGGLDMNSLMKQMSEQQKTIQNLLGE